MTDPRTTEEAPGLLSDLPLQPTGSGVADLEIAYEQMKLADDDKAAPLPSGADATQAAGDAEAESVAHPS